MKPTLEDEVRDWMISHGPTGKNDALQVLADRLASRLDAPRYAAENVKDRVIDLKIVQRLAFECVLRKRL